jgi:hypothetical protein
MALLRCPKDGIVKSNNKVLRMGSMMIILFIVHLFKKDQTYASLFSSALKEGIRDAFGEVTKKSASENIKAYDK